MIKLFNFFLSYLFFPVQVHSFELERWPNFETHREHFEKSLSELSDYDVEKMNWMVKSDQKLATAVAIVKNKKVRPEKILVMSSGIHGVESYVGSSVQLAFINEYLNRPQKKFDFAFVHILNPWGMKNNRRVNVDNVDLNRNFLADASEFKMKNEAYEKIDSFLNPKTKLQLHFAHQFMFILDSAYYILRYSMDSLRRAILSGQYHLPQGLYYGGAQNDPLKTSIDLFIEQKLADYKEVYWIDLHTGYGERGRLHLLANEKNDVHAQRLQDFFPTRHIDFGSANKFYKTTGDLISYLTGKMKSTHFAGIAFEYGTMNSQKSLGSIESLRRMVVENQCYQFQCDVDQRKHVESLLLSMYNPPENDWWQLITKQTQDIFDQILE